MYLTMIETIRNYIFLVIFLLSSIYSVAKDGKLHEQHIRLQQISTSNGLPQNTIDCILKDSKGFMWFGSWNGLCRFDGYNFDVFQKQQFGLLPGNMIQTLCEDSCQNIWIGTELGVALFNYQELNFSPINNILGNISILHIATDKLNNIWVATLDNGLWKIEKDSNNQYHAKAFLSKQFSSSSINYLMFDDEHMWVGSSNGLNIVPTNKNELSKELQSLEHSLRGTNIKKVLKDSDGFFWIATLASGVYKYASATNQLSHYGASSETNTDLNHIGVMDIAEDCNGTVIVGTLGGLNYYNKNTKSFYHLSNEEQLSSPFVNSLLADNDGNVWVGTEKGGVNHYNVFQKPFNSIQHSPGNSNTISHNTINSLLVEGDTIWIGTAGGGLNRLANNTIKQYYLSQNNDLSLNSSFVSSIYRDKQANLWIGTWGAGLNKLINPQLGKFETHLNSGSNNQSLCNNFISCIEPLNDKQLLVGTVNGFDIFTHSKQEFTHVMNKMEHTNNLAVGCLLNDSKERIWVGTTNGLYRFQKDELEKLSNNSGNINFDLFTHNKQSTESIAGNYIVSLHEALDGSIWIGTYGNGLCKYINDDDGGKFVLFTEKDGLCNNVVYRIEEDSQGNLWISTDNGLSKFNPNTNTFQNFFDTDGLLSNQFYWSASCTDDKGNLFFGGIKGVNYFSPEQIKAYRQKHEVTFTNFSIFGNSVKVGEEHHSKVILERPINECKEVNLSYKDAVFSIEFSALDYFLPEKIKYAYKMEGIDQDWVIVPASRRFASYTNLSGGKYQFKVKATNGDGVWNDKPTNLTINISPPFWKTLWFQLLIIALIIAATLSYTRYRVHFLKKQKLKLKKQVKERTSKIKEQKEKLEAQNKKIIKQRDELIKLNKKVEQVNQMRLRFFTNISHEFRTPLTLIIDPLELLMKKLENDKQTFNTLGIINRNAQRLLHLINQLLYFRKIETGKLNPSVRMGNLSELLKHIFESFNNLAKQQEISFLFQIKNQKENNWFDTEMVENIIYNLLSNAFKYTPPKGEIKLEVEFVDSNDNSKLSPPFVSIKVSDNGKGIPEENLPHIFNRFYNISESSNFNSSGIGLALTYENVKALHGNITVDSQVGVGSCFSVCLPYTKERFKPEEISNSTPPISVNINDKVDILTEIVTSKTLEHDTNFNSKLAPSILVVEDNIDLRNFLSQALHSEYKVFVAENGKIAIDLAKKHSPELIISDVMMPELNGFEMCQQLKNDIQTSHIPIILLTAKDMIESHIEGLETGADDYIAKPFNLQILQIKIRNIIDSRRKIKQLFCLPNPAHPNTTSNNKLDEEFIAKAYSVLEKNFTEENFSAEQFAKEMFVSRSLLFKKIKSLTGLSIIDFINSYKLKKAIKLMQTSNQTITEIAFNSGFNDPKYFSRIFKKFYNTSPSSFLLQQNPK